MLCPMCMPAPPCRTRCAPALELPQARGLLQGGWGSLVLILCKTTARSSGGCHPNAGSWVAIGSTQAADVLLLVVQRALVIAFATAMVTDAHRLGSGAACQGLMVRGKRSRWKWVSHGRERPEVTAALSDGGHEQDEGVRGLGCCW